MGNLRKYLADQGWYQRLSEEKYCLMTRISPELNTNARFLQCYGRKPDLLNPEFICDKQAYLKLKVYNFSPLIKRLANKVLVRDYVRACGLEDTLLELYGVWDSIDQIDFSILPAFFVMKVAMGCGNHVFCRDKATLNLEEAKKTLRKAWSNDSFLRYAELQYRPDAKVKQQVFAERMLDLPEGVAPNDYKFHCYMGEPEHMTYCYDRTTDGHAKFIRMGMDWQPRNDLLPEGRVYRDIPEKPVCFEEMKRMARILAKPFPFVRVDFYVEHDRPVFGELTFTPTGGGLTDDYTEAAERMLGDLIDLDKIDRHFLELS